METINNSKIIFTQKWLNRTNQSFAKIDIIVIHVVVLIPDYIDYY